MVTHPNPHSQRSGFLTTEALIAMSILLIAMIPFSYSFMMEATTLRLGYQRALAIQIVDGETEILANGAWRNYPIGTHIFQTRAESATNLPPGQFTLTRAASSFTLEWKPNPGSHGRTISRTVSLPTP